MTNRYENSTTEEVSLFDVSPKSVKSTKNKADNQKLAITSKELKSKILKIWETDGAQKDKRQQIISFLKESIELNKETIKTAFFKGEITGMEVLGANSKFTDMLIQIILWFATEHAIKSDIKPSDMSIIAVGGYGRRELAPYSDIDILFLTPEKTLKIHEQTAEYTLYMLWDLGIKVGQAFRSINECIADAKKDYVILTNLLEARYIWGSQRLFDEFIIEYREKLVDGFEQNFVNAKLTERANRYTKQQKSRYLLEPDVKEGCGGLRDLHLIFWLAKFLYNIFDIKELVSLNVISKHASDSFLRAHGFLSAVRCYIHFVTKRSSNTLSFDIQPEIARLMGYSDTDTSIAVEKFMKAYYLHVKIVGDLVRIVCSLLEEMNCSSSLLPANPVLIGQEKIKGFTLTKNRLNFVTPEELEENPREIIRLFRVAQKYGLDIHPKAIHHISENINHISKLEEDEKSNQLFMEILTSKSNPERILRLMSEAGVLGRFIPDFGFVIAQMQYDMYHIYTTDEHTLTAVGILHSIIHHKDVNLNEYSNRPDLEFVKKVSQKISNPKSLFISTLLHDIGKGHGGDHPVIGADIAEKISPRFGLSDEEISDMTWLIKNHQIMSQTAFQRDVYDPKTITDFVNIVKSTDRLNMLLTLTCADILAVGPNVWNEWKASLLYELYQKTLEKLTGNVVSKHVEKRIEGIKQELSQKLKDKISAKQLENFLSLGFDKYWLSYSLETLEKHAKLIYQENQNKHPICFDFIQNEKHNTTIVTIYTKDKNGVFSKIAGSLALSGTSIIDAKINTFTDGTILDSFSIQESKRDKIASISQEDAPVTSEKKQLTIIENITKSIFEDFDLKTKLEEKLKANKQRIRKISEPPRVVFDNSASETHSLIEVSADDKIGLLYLITSGIFSLGLQISSAHISTYGTRVFDVFYVKDKSGLKITNKKQIEEIKLKLVERIS
jgi:[protein-PII] uridylyltransferase